MSRIVDGLFLGSAIDANNKRWLKAHGISHILIVAKELPAFFPKDFHYKKILASDIENYDLSIHFDEIADFIKVGRAHGGI